MKFHYFHIPTNSTIFTGPDLGAILTKAPRGRNLKASRQTENSMKLLLGENLIRHTGQSGHGSGGSDTKCPACRRPENQAAVLAQLPIMCAGASGPTSKQ